MGAGDPRALELLRAGALLPVGSADEEHLPVDRVSARAFTHPALGPRVVVRLTSDPVAQGEDRVLRFLGFAAPTVTPAVGLRARRAIGFPAWALVDDPENARFALEVLGAMRRGVRQARARPGQAKDVFDAIARRLGRTVPHFLPSFHEEVGRHFAAAGNRAWAASAFARAREAERVHALEVDPAARRATFLEFALSGALTTKALSEYAQALSSEAEPVEAFRSFRELCVRRTLGGVPPWAGMTKDLRRLARAAGLDLGAEDEALVEELLGAPALARAPADFWADHREAVVRLARRSPAARDALLGLVPRPPSAGADFHERWFELLETAGAVDALAAGEADAKAAAWLTRMIGALAGRYRREWAPSPALARVAARLAPRLVADGAPVRVDESASAWWRPIDVDLCEALLAVGVPLAPPGPRATLRLDAWLTTPAAGGPGDPAHVAADERFGGLLDQAVVDHLGDDALHARAADRPALAGAIRAAVERRLAAFEREGLLGAAHALASLRTASRLTFRAHPDLHARLAALDPASVLARTLRAGLHDELGWAALDEAVAELDPRGDARLVLGGAFPYLAVASEQRAIVVGPAGRLLEHDLRPPVDAHPAPTFMRYVGGQLLVAFRARRAYRSLASWSGDPTRTFELEQVHFHRPLGVGVELGDGGVTEGGRALRAGDTTLPDLTRVLSDGATCWRRDKDPSRPRLRELDPATGNLGRASWPAFLEAFLAPGWELELGGEWDPGGCRLAPLPAGLERSPLGARDGLIGLRVRRPAPGGPASDRPREHEGVDGRRFAGRFPGGVSPAVVGLLDLPHDPRPRPITADREAITLHAPDAVFAAARLTPTQPGGPFAQGTPRVAPVDFWHHLAPRDDDGSRALREARDDDARALVDAAARALGDDDTRDARAVLDPVEAAVRERLPRVTHPALARGVAGVALEAAALARTLARVVAEQDPSAASSATGPRPVIADADLRGALQHLLSYGWGYGSDLVEELEQVSALLRRPEPLERPRALPASGLPWHELVDAIGAVAFAAVAAGTVDAHRRPLRDLLAVWATTPFAAAPQEHRAASFSFQGRFPYEPPKGRRVEQACWVIESGGGRTVLRPGTGARFDGVRSILTVRGLQHGPGGRFGDVPGATVSDERTFGPAWGSPEQLARFLALAAERGPLPWERAIGEALARRTGLSFAAAALLWSGFALAPDKALCARLGLKAREAGVAATLLRRVPFAQRLAILARALGDDPADLWAPLGRGPDDEASAAARLARAWNDVLGQRAHVPEDLQAAALRDLGPSHQVSAHDLLELFAAPARAERLAQPGCSTPRERHETTSDGFDEQALRWVAVGAAYLASTRPVGDPLRSNVPEVLRRARERLADPELLLALGQVPVAYDEAGKTREAPAADAFRRALLEGVGGVEVEWPRGPEQPPRTGRDAGLLVLVNEAWYVGVWLRPGRLKHLAELEAARRLAGGVNLSALELVLGDGYTRLTARVRETPLPPGAWEADPQRSAPALVAEVAAARGVSPDAAALYLQTLALPAPTSKLVQTMNGWTRARYEQAGQALLKAGLVVEARRERAGRAWFLPGPWEPLAAPALPLEAWKLPLLARPFERLPVLPLQPVHELFERAWRRVTEGDAPGYEPLAASSGR